MNNAVSHLFISRVHEACDDWSKDCCTFSTFVCLFVHPHVSNVLLAAFRVYRPSYSKQV